VTQCDSVTTVATVYILHAYNPQYYKDDYSSAEQDSDSIREPPALDTTLLMRQLLTQACVQWTVRVCTAVAFTFYYSYSESMRLNRAVRKRLYEYTLVYP